VSDDEKAKEWKPAAVADRRNLCAETFIADIAAEVKNDRRILAHAHWMMTNPVHPLLTRI
jgi:hypothetical protein